MDLSTLKSFFLSCFIANYLILVFWWLTVIMHWDLPYTFSAKSFGISRERVMELNFQALILYKVGIVLFNLVPLVALWAIKSG